MSGKEDSDFVVLSALVPGLGTHTHRYINHQFVGGGRGWVVELIRNWGFIYYFGSPFKFLKN